MDIEREAGSPALRVVGEVDLSNAEELRSALAAEVDEAGSAILDLSRCTYLGSEGIRVIIDAWNRTPDEGRIVLRGPTRLVRRVLDTAGLGRFPKVEIQEGP
jgi:anti-sigma B factor antagonist